MERNENEFLATKLQLQSSYYDATTDHECDLHISVYSRMDNSAIDQLPEYMKPYEENMKVALVTGAQDMLSITSMIGMREDGKEDLDWILTKPEDMVTRSQEIAASQKIVASHAHPGSLWSHRIPMTEVKISL
ncbi:Trehalose-6-P synthase/phosphatase complex synthase subunit [Dionaea muscipula]